MKSWKRNSDKKKRTDEERAERLDGKRRREARDRARAKELLEETLREYDRDRPEDDGM